MGQPGLMVREQGPCCACMRVHVLPLALHISSVTVLLHFIQVRKGAWALLLAGSAGTSYMISAFILPSQQLFMHQLSRGNYSEWLTSQGCVNIAGTIME